MLDNYKEGERIKVSFDLRGREWNGKYLTNLNAWRIERAGEGDGGGGNSQENKATENFPADPFPNYTDVPPATGNFDDLPF
jgi:hypothetical protein